LVGLILRRLRESCWGQPGGQVSSLRYQSECLKRVVWMNETIEPVSG